MIDIPDDPLERIAAALERIAAALEDGALGGMATTRADPRGDAVAELRLAIRGGEFAKASTLLGDFELDFPDAPEAAVLTQELADSRRAAITDRRARLEAARKAADPEASISLRDELAPLLDSGAREDLDRDLIAWLMSVLMKRLRAGTVRPDVAALAARVAGSFAHRPEGASLRASLPTLRRSAGLCPRCSEPYTGVEDACPNCLAVAPKIADLPETPAQQT